MPPTRKREAVTRELLQFSGKFSSVIDLEVKLMEVYCWEGRTCCGVNGRPGDSDFDNCQKKKVQGVTVLLQDMMTEKHKLMTL